MARRASRWRLCGAVLGHAALVAVPTSAAAQPSGPQNKPVVLEELVEQVVDVERVVAAAERAASTVPIDPASELAKKLVEGQLKLVENDHEGAAVVFLDLLENHPNSTAGIQAVHYLGEALARLGMDRWAGEMFAKNLTDNAPEAVRFHQKSVARLFDLAAPRRPAGFARQPGLSATPEARARLSAMGLPTTTVPLEGAINPDDVARLARWAESFPSASRIPQLRYAYGRYLYLKGEHEKALAELDGVSPLDIPLSRGGPEGTWRIRAAYVAGATALALDKPEEAIDRFSRITQARPEDPRDRQIVDLSWMAIARVHHDAGQMDRAVKAYRQISRDSPFFPEAMYETAWTLLRVGRFERALGALEQLLAYDPDSPVAPEIKALHAKVKIQERDYEAAEKELLELRSEYETLGRQLSGRLHAGADASKYFAAVVGEDMEHFSLASLMPVQVVPVAESLARTQQAIDLTRALGRIDHELFETRALLGRMEQAVRAKERARVFTDLGASVTSLDAAVSGLVKIQSDLVRRLGASLEGATRQGLERQRRALEAKLEQPSGGPAGNMATAVTSVEAMSKALQQLESTINEHRAQLVAVEHNYNVTQTGANVEHQQFLNLAAEVRDLTAADERDAAELRVRIKRVGAALMFDDPWRDARRSALDVYAAHLTTMYETYSGAKRDTESDKLWTRSVSLLRRVGETRVALETTANTRLERAMAVLEEEHANVESYVTQLEAKREQTKALVADVLSASFRDVVSELDNHVVRSEVGLLDVAWSRKEVEQSEVRRLETARDRDMTELQMAVDAALEELGR